MWHTNTNLIKTDTHTVRTHTDLITQTYRVISGLPDLVKIKQCSLYLRRWQKAETAVTQHWYCRHWRGYRGYGVTAVERPSMLCSTPSPNIHPTSPHPLNPLEKTQLQSWSWLVLTFTQDIQLWEHFNTCVGFLLVPMGVLTQKWMDTLKLWKVCWVAHYCCSKPMTYPV